MIEYRRIKISWWRKATKTPSEKDEFKLPKEIWVEITRNHEDLYLKSNKNRMKGEKIKGRDDDKKPYSRVVNSSAKSPSPSLNDERQALQEAEAQVKITYEPSYIWRDRQYWGIMMNWLAVTMEPGEVDVSNNVTTFMAQPEPV